jgi:parallel beta-helix repeat protein
MNKKFISIGLVLIFSLVSLINAQWSAQWYGKKIIIAADSIIFSCDVLPDDDGLRDLGGPSVWFDSSFVEHGWFNYIQVDSGLVTPTGRTATITIAASNSLQKSKDQADYVCDGTNDEVEIQAAIDALPDSGGRILLLEGNYLINRQSGKLHALRINKSNIQLMGVGQSSILYLVNGQATADSACRVIEIDSTLSDITIEDLQINGNSTNQTDNTGSAGILGLGTTADSIFNITISNCYVKNCYFDAVCVRYGNNVAFQNNVIDSCYEGLLMSYCKRSIMVNNMVSNCDGEDGLEYSQSLHCQILGNIVINTKQSGIDVYRSNYVDVISNTVIDAGEPTGVSGPGIAISGTTVENVSRYCVVSGNTVENSRGGIEIQGPYNIITNNVCTNDTIGWGEGAAAGGILTTTPNGSYNLILGNTCIGNRNGIYIHESSGNFLSNNSCDSNVTWGIVVHADADSTILTANNTLGNGGGFISNAGTNTRLRFSELSAGNLTVNEDIHVGADSIGIGIGTPDSTWIFHSSGNLNIKPDNNFVIKLGNWMTFTGINWYAGADTMVRIGYADYRNKEVWALRQQVSSPNKADTGTVYYDAHDTLHIEAEDGDVIKISGIIASTNTTRGQATFSAICLIDTVIVSGVTTNSFVFLTVKSTTAPTSDLSWAYLNTDSITVHCLAADTAMLRQNPYSWFRIE